MPRTSADRALDDGVPVAVVGAGSIGVGWSVVFARAGHPVTLFDPDSARRQLAREELRQKLIDLHDANLLDEHPTTVAGRVLIADALREVVSTGCVYIQECAPEDCGLKQSLFAELDELAEEEVILASSSSALTASSFTSGLRGARRCLVAHPGNPPYLLRVVEVVPSPFTDAGVTDRTEQLLRAAGMVPVRLRREIAGFVFNRLQAAVLREAYRLVGDGVVSPGDLDLVMREGLGRRWAVLGPFETAELNTRGGIEVHARRLGPAYLAMEAETGRAVPFREDIVKVVASSVQDRWPRQRWTQHVAERDRALMAIEACLGRGPSRGRHSGQDLAQLDSSPQSP